MLYLTVDTAAAQ